MPRSLVLGNGNMLIAFDRRAQVADFYFPHVGLENHTHGACVHKIGVWVDGSFSWFQDPQWDISTHYEEETLASTIVASHPGLQVQITFNDVVYNEKNIFIREVTVKNLARRTRTFKIFFNQQFRIYESSIGNTAYYDPAHESVIHYKGRRVFLISGRNGDKNFDDYSVGSFGIEGKEGTFKDAEDGYLSKNPIEHGPVDSVIGFTLTVTGTKSATFHYFVAVAETLKEVLVLHEYVQRKTAPHLIETTKDFWHAWVNKINFTFHGLPKEVVRLFKTSLIIIRTHIDANGGILASGDSDMLQYGRDTYCYMWHRDAAFTAIALDKAGYSDITRRFFEFCNEVVSDDGYFFHKYSMDKSLGSSWHPWILNNKPQLPIQEDETALTLYAFWKHYEASRDLEFVESVYNSLIKKMADFLCSFRDQETHLPLPTYDLWEQKSGTSTFTCASVYAALLSASRFAKLLGKEKHEEAYRECAEEVKDATLTYLFNDKDGSFYKLLRTEDGALSYDSTIDMSSFFGVFRFNILDLNDSRLIRFAKLVEERLSNKTSFTGVARYEGDDYYRIDPNTPGNPWFITTLWLAQYLVACSKNEKDLEVVKKYLMWAVEHALPSGIFSEQINPHTGEQISAAPLTWSHAAFVLTVIKYMEKLEELGVAKMIKE